MDNKRKIDRPLISTLDEDDWKAFTSIYEAYWKKLYAYANNVLRDEESSKDVLQDVFLDFWDRRKTTEIKNVSAYLYTAVKYQLVARLAKAKSFQRVQLEKIEELLASDHRADQSLRVKEIKEVLNQKLHELPNRCREIFTMSRFDGLSNKEIADELSISVSTVENQLNKALRILKADGQTIG